MENKNIFIVSIAGLVATVLLLIMLCSITIIGAGEVGVVTSFGKVESNTLTSGFYLKYPWEIVHKISYRILTTSAASNAASNDLQNVFTNLTLNFSIEPKDASKLYITVGENIGYLEKQIIDPALNEGFKAVVAKYNAEELINKRALVSNDIHNEIQNKLNMYGIKVDSIALTNFSFTKAYDNAIEQKVIAQQHILTAENELQTAKVEAQQKIVQAQANATAMNLQRSSITPELIQLKQVEVQMEIAKRWTTPNTLVIGSQSTLLPLK